MSTIILTEKLKSKLQINGVSARNTGAILPRDTIFEPPCAIKWMQISHSFYMGAFSYGVNGFFFGCRIGRYCSFGEQVQVGRHPHAMHWVTTSPYFYTPYGNVLDMALPDGIEMAPSDFRHKTGPGVAKITTIGNDVWIGHGGFIMPGITIGDGAVVGAMAVVTKDVPPYAVVVGSPARIMKFRFPDKQVKMLLNSKWWEYAPWDLKGAPVDDIPAFVEFVKDLRQRDVPVHKPKVITLSEITK